MKFVYVVVLFLLGAGCSSSLAFDLDNIDLDQVQSVYLLIYDSKYKKQDAKKSRFVLDVYVDGKLSPESRVISHKVSPGKLVDNPEPGKEPELTPEGKFHPTRMFEEYTSKQFGGKILGIFETGKMPFSIFFHKGFAIHGSRSTVNGKPASKGCVRQKVKDSKKVYRLVEAAIENTGLASSVTIDIRHTESDYVAKYRVPKKSSSVGQHR